MGSKALLIVFFIAFQAAGASAAKILDEAKEKRDQGLYSEAIELYKEALTIQPNDVDTQLALAQALAWSSRHDEAIAVYDKIIDQYPEHTDALLGKAFVLSWQKKYKPAEELFREVIDLSPDYLDAQMGLARMMAWQGKHDEAEKIAQRAADKNPDSAEAAALMAQIYFWGGRSDLALPYYKKLVEKDPDNVQFLTGLARAYWEEGKHKKAAATLKKAIDLAPDRPELRAELGQYYARALRLDDAITEIQRSIALKTANIDDYVTLGRVYAYKSETEKSKQLYREALAKDPNNTDALNGLARTYGYERNWMESRRTFQKVLAMDPKNIEAREGLNRLDRIEAPELSVWYEVLRILDKEPANIVELEVERRGPFAEFRYKFNPDNSLLVRGGRFIETQKNRSSNQKEIHVNRTEAGVGGRVRLGSKWNLLGRADWVKFSDRGDALLTRSDDGSRGAGFLVADYEQGRHLFSVTGSKDVFLREVPGEGVYDPVTITDYSVSDDIDWTNEFSTLFKAGQDFLTTIDVKRVDALMRPRVRPRFLPSFQFDGQVRYRDNPNQWNVAGFVKWKTQTPKRKLFAALTAALHHDTLTDVTGPELRGFLSWNIAGPIRLNEDISYQSNVGFKGSIFNSKTYFVYEF